MKINGQEYKIPEISFNEVIRLQELGANIYDGTMISTQSLTFLRGFVALSSGLGIDGAGELLGSHVISGGDLSDIWKEIGEAIENSRFLQQVIQQAEAKMKKAKEVVKA